MSDWKNIKKRLRVFTGQIFGDIYAELTKENSEWNAQYLQDNFYNLFAIATEDPNVTANELKEFTEKHESNLKQFAEKYLSFPKGK